MKLFDSDAKKISIITIIAVLSAFALFLFIMSLLPDSVYVEHENFYKNQLADEKKIFLVGSSHIYALNSTLITKQLLAENKSYLVYNLGQAADDPESRLRTIDMMISQKPSLVLYGIGLRDFVSSGREASETTNNLLPELVKVTDVLSLIDLPLNNDILENPKFAMIRAMLGIINKDQTTETKRVYNNAPFFPYRESATTPAEITKLEKSPDLKIGEIYSLNKNTNFQALREIISKLKENNIDVIIFSTPHSPIWWEHQSPTQIQIFNEMLDNLKNNLDVPVYRLDKKYSEIDIWEDNTHLIIGNKTRSYSTDIADIIITNTK